MASQFKGCGKKMSSKRICRETKTLDNPMGEYCEHRKYSKKCKGKCSPIS